MESFPSQESVGLDQEAIKPIRIEIVPNEGQRTEEWQKVLPVVVEALSEEDAPESITRLSAAKSRFLVESIAQVKAGSQVLELFAGSNLGTVKIAERTNPKNITCVDLHYQIDSEKGILWKYNPEENFRRAAEIEGLKKPGQPTFISSDASELSFPENNFDFVIAPDSPRSGESRFEEDSVSGSESELDYEGQKILFLKSAEEAYRVLKNKGVFVATAPLSWAKELRSLGRFKEVTIFSHEPLEGVTKIEMGGHFRFNTKNNDPVVYLRAVKR